MSDNDVSKIIIVDDHPIVRQGLAMLIDQHEDFSVCGEAESADEAMDLIEQTNPDLAIVDLSLAESSGLDLIKELKIHHPDLRSVVLSMHDESVYAPRALEAGARGYVMKREAKDHIVSAIQRVMNGEIYVSDKMASKLLELAATGKSGESQSPISRLTDRELEVFELIGQGLTTRQISERFHRSIKTIEAHREHIKEKLGLKNSTELSRHAFQWVESGGISSN